MEKVRTRFAPSPTGKMHVGNLRSAIFEYLVAKSLDGDFILRIEDTDQKRKVEGAEDLIFDTLEKCGITIDESPKHGGDFGPYVQSERIEIYKEYAHKLVEEKNAYFCFCSSERLDKLRKEAEEKKVAFLYDGHCSRLSKEEVDKKINNGEKYVIRQKTPNEGISAYNDLVYGEIKVENKLLEDQILLKSDGFPTYNFANVIDDNLMGITHIVRGNEYLSSTPKYNLLYDAFGFERPKYIHLPLVVDEERKKLSKRHGASPFKDLENKGYLPEGIVNYLALLGFSPETNDEIFTLDELVEIFKVNRINKSPAVYDVKKLNWINAHYMKKLEEKKLFEITIPHLKNNYNTENKSDEWLKELVLLYQDHISFGEEIVKETELFFQNDLELPDEAKDILESEGVNEMLLIFKEQIEKIEDWNVSEISNAINKTKEISGVKGKMLFMPIRIKTSGRMHGPELPNTIYLIGKDNVLNRF